MSRPRTLTVEERKQKIRQRVKDWKKKNPDKLQEQLRRYREKHTEEIRIYQHNRYKAMKEKKKKEPSIIYKSRCPSLFPKWYFCARCDYRLSLDYIYCPKCGKKLNWEQVKVEQEADEDER